MSSHRHDRNLLFGILALQMNLISRDELLAATNEWITSSRRSLGEILKARRALGEEECSLLEGAVARHVELHGGDIGGSLAGFLSIARATVATRARSQTARDGIVAAGEAPASIARDEAGRGAAEGTTQRYQVLWPHARGGLGEVYVAEDGELHRRVALKEIQPRYAGDPVSRERFVVEAEITGNLEHPGIVPVYGLGWRPDGRPYYAMRFINGEELSKAIRRFHAGDAPDFQGLEFRWLLRRFIDVCNTIAYAHSRGVLHRDIKPGNIMLGPFGETLVMDWGVAKPVGRSEPATGGQAPSAPSDEPTIRPYSGGGGATLRGQAVGTPSYMSPEQAAGELDAMGPASDVYSLGATLYVLLANRPPFAGEPAEVLEDVQRGRFVAPRAIQPRVPRVLEAICRKAMAVQPARRYSSALALADDLERWLADEPVSAWREPWTARLRRWVRRHQPIVAGAAAAVIVAIAALGLAVPVLSIAWRNEAEARRAEAGQRIHAMQKAQEAEKALSFLVQAFRKPDPEVDGRSLKVVDLLDRAVAELDRALSDQPRMQATLWTAIGKTYSGLGMPREAIEVFQRALDRRRGLLGEDHPETLDSDHNLAMAYQDAGRYDQAIPLLETTLAKRRAARGDDHAETIQSMNDLAWAYWKAGRPREAIPLYEAALARVRAARGEDHLHTLTILDNLAVAYAAAGEPARAIPLHQQVLAGLQAKRREDHAIILVTMNNLARAYQGAHRLDEAIRLRETTVAKLRETLGQDHPTTLTAMNGLAEAYRDTGKIDQAAAVFRTVLAHRRARLGDDHPDTLLTTFTLAKLEFEARRSDQAIPLARAFLDRAGTIAGRLPAKVRDAIPQAAGFLVEHYRRAGQHDLAERFRAIQQRRSSTQTEAPQPPNTSRNPLTPHP